MGDGHRQRVGGIFAGDLRTGEEAGDHRVDLRLLGAAHPDHRLRLTIGLVRRAGRWTVTHEHHSFPDRTTP